MERHRTSERVQVVVIGAGQAGLSVGYYLAKQRVSFVMLDGNQQVGDSWRTRWDSLRLFTPARFDGLAGMPFPSSPDGFPTKDEMARYLETYAATFRLPVQMGCRVEELSRDGRRYTVAAGDRRFEADHVVVAMANYQRPFVPTLAGELSPRLTCFHSREYRNPAQLQPGGVLLVGAGNSGSEIALEVARAGHPTWMSGRDTGALPFRIDGLVGRMLAVPFVLRFLFHRVLTLGTPLGRLARPRVVHKGGPLIRVRARDLERAGVQRVGRTVGARDGLPELEDGRILDVSNVIWCTGFRPGFDWIHMPIFDEYGEPRHDRGIVPDEPGLYFVGLHFLYAMSSTMIHGVGRDARHVVRRIAARLAESPQAAPGHGDDALSRPTPDTMNPGVRTGAPTYASAMRPFGAVAVGENSDRR
jgi:putative flavoprotein involved in K+ transport